MQKLARIHILTYLILTIFNVLGFAESNEPVLIAASGTSYSSGSGPVSCLLDLDCTGYWSPETKDVGVNEGIYLQFKEPVELDYIEVRVEGDLETDLFLKPYLDGKTMTKLPWSAMDDIYEKIGTTSFLRGEDTIFLIGGGQAETPLNYKAKSVFIKISMGRNYINKVPKIKSIRFFNDNYYTSEHSDPIKIKLPISVKSNVSATSTLSPKLAYDVTHLFDSQMDMAWSTDGKTTSGIGEKVKLKLAKEYEIYGLMVWNGYQRSQTHFNANGRVKSLDINGQTVALGDKQGFQMVRLKKAMKVSDLALTIMDVYKGEKYKDVLISELRLLTTGDKIVLPQVAMPRVKTPLFLKDVVDHTFFTVINSAEVSPSAGDYDESVYDYQASMRIRSNGTFVIYKDWPIADNRKYHKTTNIIEGNWEEGPENTIRLFGKKYEALLNTEDSEYLEGSGETSLPAPKIFQSVLSIIDYNKVAQPEKDSFIKYIIKTRTVFSPGKMSKAVVCTVLKIPYGDDSYVTSWFKGTDMNEAFVKMDKDLKKLNPILVKSDVFTELLLPYEQITLGR